MPRVTKAGCTSWVAFAAMLCAGAGWSSLMTTTQDPPHFFAELTGDDVLDRIMAEPGVHEDTGMVTIEDGLNKQLVARITGAAPGGLFGHSLVCDWDIDGDGFGDLLIGAPFDDGGRVYLFYGPILAKAPLLAADDADVIFDAPAADTFEFGDAIGVLPDIDGDGAAEVIIRGYAPDQSGGVVERSYVISGGNGVLVLALSTTLEFDPWAYFAEHRDERSRLNEWDLRRVIMDRLERIDNAGQDQEGPAQPLAPAGGGCPGCVADLDGNGVVDGGDLAVLLGSFGPCPAPPASCPADLNGDNVVDSADIPLLLGKYGCTWDPSDSDGDGIPDVWEEFWGFDPCDPSDALSDPDGDGLTNLQEFLWDLDPTWHDSDDDGIPDGGEVLGGSDPHEPDKEGPNAGNVLYVKINFGDQSCHFSDTWAMEFNGITYFNPAAGNCSEPDPGDPWCDCCDDPWSCPENDPSNSANHFGPLPIERGNTYAIKMHHLGGAYDEGPDYDWTSMISLTDETGASSIPLLEFHENDPGTYEDDDWLPAPPVDGVFVTDPNKLMGQRWTSGASAPTQTAWLNAVKLVSIKGLFTEDGAYEEGYFSDDDKGRIYSNREYDVNNPAKTAWTKDSQYVDFEVKAGSATGVKVVWEFVDPDDPSDDPPTHPSAQLTIDPNGSAGDDNTGERGAAGSQLLPWEQIDSYTLVIEKNELATTEFVNGVSKVRFHVQDHGGDNYKVKVSLRAAEESGDGLIEETGLMTVWKLIDVEYVQMPTAAALDFVGANDALASTFVELRELHRDDVEDLNEMGANGIAAYAKCNEYVTQADGEFSMEGEPGWFFSAAAHHFVTGGGPPTLYEGPATVHLTTPTFELRTLQLPPGEQLAEIDHLMTTFVTQNLPPQGEHRVLKVNGVIFNDLYADGTIFYSWQNGEYTEAAAIISHQADLPAGETIVVYDGVEDIPLGRVDLEKINVSSVSLLNPNDPSEYATFESEAHTWSPTLRKFNVLGKDYPVPGQFIDNPPTTFYDLVDHGFAGGTAPYCIVQGAGALSITGISPGPGPYGGFEGRTIVFTADGGGTNTLVHEFGHGLGFTHKCGLWDYRSHGVGGNACTMHYASWYSMLNLNGVGLELWTHGQDVQGPYFCEEHMILIRQQELENYWLLGWGNP